MPDFHQDWVFCRCLNVNKICRNFLLETMLYRESRKSRKKVEMHRKSMEGKQRHNSLNSREKRYCIVALCGRIRLNPCSTIFTLDNSTAVSYFFCCLSTNAALILMLLLFACSSASILAARHAHLSLQQTSFALSSFLAMKKCGSNSRDTFPWIGKAIPREGTSPFLTDGNNSI